MIGFLRKKIILALVFCLVISLAILKYKVESNARINFKNIYKIQVGMPTAQAILIMGKPDKILYNGYTGYSEYEYLSFIGMSSSFFLYVDEHRDIVEGINYGH